MLDWVFFTAITALILYGCYYYLKRIRLLSQAHQEKARNFSENLIVGIVAGIVVVVLSEGVPLILKSFPKVDWSPIVPLLKSIIGLLLITTFEGGLLLLLILYVVHKGFSGIVRKK